TPKLDVQGTGTATILGNLTQATTGALALSRSSAPGTLVLMGTSNLTGAVAITNGTIQTAVMTSALGSPSGGVISIRATGILAPRSDDSATCGNGSAAYNISITSTSGPGTINVDQANMAAPGTSITVGAVTMNIATILQTTGANVNLSIGTFSNSGINNGRT